MKHVIPDILAELVKVDLAEVARVLTDFPPPAEVAPADAVARRQRLERIYHDCRVSADPVARRHWLADVWLPLQHKSLSYHRQRYHTLYAEGPAGMDQYDFYADLRPGQDFKTMAKFRYALQSAHDGVAQDLADIALTMQDIEAAEQAMVDA